MESGTERISPPTTYELLVRVERVVEKQNTFFDSLRDIKADISSIKSDMRSMHESMREEFTRSMDDRIEPLAAKVRELETCVNTLNSCMATMQGSDNSKNKIFTAATTLMLLYLTYKQVFG